MSRFLSLMCVGLLLGLLAPVASAQKNIVEPGPLAGLIADLKSPDEKVRDKAIQALANMGPAAKPAAAALVEVALNTRGHAAALHALVKIDDNATRAALRQLLVARTGRCKCGKSFLDVVVSAGEPIVPQLLVMLPEKEFTRDIESVLAQIGEPAVPHMIAQLTEEKSPEATTIAIYRSLAAMGPKAKSAVPTLESGLRCDKGSTKLQRAHALLRISGSHQAALNALHEAVRGSDNALKLEALACLRTSGAKAKELIPTMLEFVIADDQKFHPDAIETLINIGKPAVEPLVNSITTVGCRRFNRNLFTRVGEKNPKHTERVLYTLHRMGSTATEAIPIFIQLVEGSDIAMAIYAADALPDFGPEARQSIPSLVSALASESAPLSMSSANALVRIDRKQAALTIAPLVKVLNGIDAKDRQRALWQLANLGADAKPAVPAMVALLKTDKLAFRLQVADALGAIDRNQQEAVLPTILEALQTTGADNEAFDRIDTALNLVEDLGPKAKQTIPALKTLLQKSLKADQNRNVHPGMVMRTLKAIDSTAEAMPILIEGLNNTDANRRREAAQLVRQFRGAAALPMLQSAVDAGTLQSSAELTNLLKTLRPQTPGAN